MKTIQKIDELLQTDIIVERISDDGESVTSVDWLPLSFEKTT